jgi:hypothetical protein
MCFTDIGKPGAIFLTALESPYFVHFRVLENHSIGVRDRVVFQGARRDREVSK